jgi:hypothetical protein
MSARGPGCVKTRKRLIAIETSYSFKADLGAQTASHSILKSNLRISFSSRLKFLSFHTAWALSGQIEMSSIWSLFGGKADIAPAIADHEF